MPDYHQGTLVVTRPPHFPTMHTREQVVHCAAFGLTIAQIAVVIRCTAEDVTRYYAAELENGLARVNAQVQAAVLHNALYEGDTQAQKLWLINKAGWRAGDGPRGQLAPGQETPSGEGETIVQRRTIIESVLTRVTRDKRLNEKVINATVVAQPRSKETVARSDDATSKAKTSNGTNGAGGANGNGTKHR